MISPDEFFGKYDQKPIDFDGSLGNQCVDVYRQFIKECIECPQSPPVKGAYQIWDTYLPEYFDRILNTIEAIPIKGDIIIWGTEVGGFGHIAICKDGTQQSFTSFDQNWPVSGYVDTNGNFIGTGVCHFQPHNYNGVLGWLRRKSPVTNPPTTLTTATTVTTNTSSSSQTTNPPSDCCSKLETAKNILYSKNFFWIKLNKLKELLPKE